MGLFGGSTTTTTNENFDSGPSSWQKPYLDDAFNSARSIYSGARDDAYYQGETYAGMSDSAKATLDKLKAYAAGQGLSTAGQLSSIGTSMAGYGSNAADLTSRIAAMASEDPTQANIAAAQKYADNPYLSGIIDANARDVTRNLTENDLPSIDRAASATGNINSSRAGVAAGIARRGAEDRIGDISASLRGNAYSEGLSRAQADRASNMSALGSAANAYTSLAGFGVDALGKGTDAAYGAYDAIGRANAQEQGDRQGQLDADYDKWKGEDERQWDLLSRYANIVAGNQWGQSGTSTSTSKQKSSQSILGQIAGIAASAGSIYTGLGGFGRKK